LALHSFTADALKVSETTSDPTTREKEAANSSGTDHLEASSVLTINKIEQAFALIRTAELPLTDLLISGLKRSSRVRVLATSGVGTMARLPVVSFLHESISSKTIVTICAEGGFICRCGKFLSADQLQNDYNFYDSNDGVVRFSLAHYNTLQEVQMLLELLESIPKWF
jgi:selenocysteine lyase/cysteine desulfurase